MTELTREQIEEVRRGFPHSEALSAICDMALGKKDAERRAERAGGLARYWRHWAENYAGQAQRAEAEVEDAYRLVDYWRNQCREARHKAGIIDDPETDALATPPPEGESRLDEYPTDAASMTRREYLESQGEATPPEGEPSTAQIVEAQQWPIDSDAPQAPEQNGDALAALDRTQYWRWVSDPRGFVSSDVPVALLVQVVEDYRRLTASGVPYEIRQLPDHLDGLSVKYGRNLMPEAANAFHDAANEARDFIKRAIAAAPTDGRE